MAATALTNPTVRAGTYFFSLKVVVVAILLSDLVRLCEERQDELRGQPSEVTHQEFHLTRPCLTSVTW